MAAELTPDHDDERQLLASYRRSTQDPPQSVSDSLPSRMPFEQSMHVPKEH